jgi:prevent-host-death family protein
MADVGVRELKQRLSEYLDRAERGEILRVTDRGRPKALLGPLPGRARVEQGVSEGWIRAGSGGTLPRVARVKSKGRVLDSLAEDRGE